LGNRTEVSISPFTPDVIAFSRILDAGEVLVIDNTRGLDLFQGEAIVNADLNQADDSCLFSNSTKNCPAPGLPTYRRVGSVSIRGTDGSMSAGRPECCRSPSGRWKCRFCGADRSVSYEAALTLPAECAR
jgi:hypothetical protein